MHIYLEIFSNNDEFISHDYYSSGISFDRVL